MWGGMHAGSDIQKENEVCMDLSVSNKTPHTGGGGRRGRDRDDTIPEGMGTTPIRMRTSMKCQQATQDT